MVRRLSPWCAALVLGACSAAPRDSGASCGVHSVRAIHGPRLDPMKPVPACELPTAAEIALACQVRPPAGAGGRPRYEVSGESCAFADRRRRAACVFDLAEPGSPGSPRRAEVSFVHRYYEAVGEPDASGYDTVWDTEGPCRLIGDAQ